MTVWLERKEKVLRYEQYIKWQESNQQSLADLNPLHKHSVSHVFMTREPSAKAVPFYRVKTVYGAADFESCLVDFVARFNNPDASSRELKIIASRVRLRFGKMPVYHKAKFWEADFPRYRHAIRRVRRNSRNACTAQ